MNTPYTTPNALIYRDPWLFVKKHRVLATSVGILVATCTMVYSLAFYHNKYSSDAMVLIKDSAISTSYVLPEQNYAIQTTSSNASNPVLNTMGLLKSESISDALWQYLKTQHPEELQKLHLKTQEDWRAYFAEGRSLLKAKNMPATDMITLEFKWETPEVAKGGLETVLKAFQDTSKNINRAEQESRSKYLANQVVDIEQKLADLRERKSKYKQEMQTINISQESTKLADESIRLASRLNEVEAEASGKEAEFLRYQNMLHLSPENALNGTALGMNTTLNDLQNKLYQLNQQYAELKITLTPKNPKLQEITSQIEAAKENIKSEMTRTLTSSSTKNGKNAVAISDSTRGTIISQMVSARAESIQSYTQAQVMHKRLADIDKLIHDLPNKEQQLANMEEEEKSLSSALDTLRQKQLEAQLKQAETLSNVFIIDKPRLPGSPKFPTKIHLLFIGLLGGILAGMGAAWARYYWGAAMTTGERRQAFRPNPPEVSPEPAVSKPEVRYAINNPPVEPIAPLIFEPVSVSQPQPEPVAIPEPVNSQDDWEWTLNDLYPGKEGTTQEILKQTADLPDWVKPTVSKVSGYSFANDPIEEDTDDSAPVDVFQEMATKHGVVEETVKESAVSTEWTLPSVSTVSTYSPAETLTAPDNTETVTEDVAPVDEVTDNKKKVEINGNLKKRVYEALCASKHS